MSMEISYAAVSIVALGLATVGLGSLMYRHSRKCETEDVSLRIIDLSENLGAGRDERLRHITSSYEHA